MGEFEVSIIRLKEGGWIQDDDVQGHYNAIRERFDERDERMYDPLVWGAYRFCEDCDKKRILLWNMHFSPDLCIKCWQAPRTFLRFMIKGEE